MQLTQRVGWQKAVVAVANKNARILWAVLTKGERFDAHHVSVKPPVPTQSADANRSRLNDKTSNWRVEVPERHAFEDALTGQTGGR